MLITQLKAKEAITSLTAGKKVFIINCHGCKEVRFPEKEAARLQKELAAEGNVTGIMTTDYICNPENMELRLKKHMSKIQEADLVLVFSCGVGVQTVSEYLEDKMYSFKYFLMSSSKSSFPSFQRRRIDITVNSLEIDATWKILSLWIFNLFSRFPYPKHFS